MDQFLGRLLLLLFKPTTISNLFTAKIKFLALFYYTLLKLNKEPITLWLLQPDFDELLDRNPTLSPEQLGRFLIVKTYNRFATDRETSSVEIANVLFDQNEYYSLHQFVNINLEALEAEMKYHFQH